MKKAGLVLVVAVFCAVTTVTAAGSTAAGLGSTARSEIGMYDLKHTLNCPVSDSPRYMDVWDECHAVSTLQGIVNRDQPRLFVDYIVAQGTNVDRYWLDKFSAKGQWLEGCKTKTYTSPEELVAAYRDLIKGVVLYDSRVAATSNVASTVAGVENLVAVRYDPRPGSLYDRLVASGPKLPVKVSLVGPGGESIFTGRGTIPGTNRRSTGSAKCDAYVWMIENYIKKGLCNAEFAGYYIDQKWRDLPNKAARNHHTLSNHDFFVSRKAFFFDLSPWADEAATDDPAQKPGADLAVLKELLSEAYKANGGQKFCHVGGFPPWALKYTDHVGGKHADVATEWEFARLLGSYNAYIDADALALGALANASFWQHFPLREQYPQKWVTREELQRRGYLTADGKVDLRGRQFIIFYVGDYDSAAWLTQRMPSIWDDPNRGKIPLMWCLSPALDRRAPEVMHYCRTTATPNDYFASGDNGAGYLLPSSLQKPRASGLPDGVQAWGEHCKPFFDRWGLTITGFVINPGTVPLNDDALDCYARFSPNGIVVSGPGVPITMLHGDMPVMRNGITVSSNNKTPAEAARALVAQIAARQPVPFHWFRTILRTPTWHVEAMEEVHRLNPKVELLDAPTFFELYRIWLRDNLEAAAGELKTAAELRNDKKK